MIKIEIQYFEGCPHTSQMMTDVKQAITDSGVEAAYTETEVDTVEKAIESAFRGSPTLLIDGEDYERLPAPENPLLACRFYSSGLPTVPEIVKRLLSN